MNSLPVLTSLSKLVYPPLAITAVPIWKKITDYKGAVKLFLALILALASTALSAQTSQTAASPCDGIDRSLTIRRKTMLARIIARQMSFSRVNVEQSFRYGGWSIIYFSTPDAESAYLFYSGDPRRVHYVTTWSGVALPEEQEEIRKGVVKDAPGIPSRLASCFAWHVTNE